MGAEFIMFTHSNVAYPSGFCFNDLILYNDGQIKSLSSAIMNIPKDYLQLEARENALKKVSELLSRHPDGIPLDPEVDMKVYCFFFTLLVFRICSLSFLSLRDEYKTFYLIRFGAALTKRLFVDLRLWKTYLKNTRLQNLHS